MKLKEIREVAFGKFGLYKITEKYFFPLIYTSVDKNYEFLKKGDEKCLFP
jgi:hypothetical protein